MGQNLPENMQVLRLFGAERAAVEQIVQQAHSKADLKIQTMERGSETLVVIETTRVSASSIRAILNGWHERFAEQCGGALYGVGETTLMQASLNAMIQEKILFACADAATGALMTEKLADIEAAQHVFEFGNNSYAHPKFSKKIANGSRFAAKYPADSAQQIAGRMKACYQCSGADYIVAFLPMEGGAHLVMLGDKTGYLVRKIDATEKPFLWLMDMLRRASLDLPDAKGARYIKYGEPLPKQFACALPLYDEAMGEQAVTATPVQEMPTHAGLEHNEMPNEMFDELQNKESVDVTQNGAPEPEDCEASGSRFFTALILVALFALVALAGAYFVSGGDITSLWNYAGLPDMSVSNASFM